MSRPGIDWSNSETAIAGLKEALAREEARVAELNAALWRVEDIYEENSPPEVRLLRMFEVANHMSDERGSESPSEEPK